MSLFLFRHHKKQESVLRSDKPGRNVVNTKNLLSIPKRLNNYNLKKLLSFLKVLILIFIFVWLFKLLLNGWADLIEYNQHIRYDWIFLSGLFYLVAFLPSVIFWFMSLRWLGQRPSLWNSFKAFYFSQLGKYIPGKAFVVLIRTEMISSPYVRANIAAASVFYETLMMMGSGAFIAACIVFGYFRQHWFFSCMALGVAIISLIPLTPPCFKRLLKILHIGKGDEQVQNSLQQLRYCYLFKGFGLMIFLWVCFGLSLWATIKGLGITSPPLISVLPRYISVVALAMTLGFAIPISPGGLGIREGVISSLLIPYFTTVLNDPINAECSITAESLAAIVAIIQRMTSIISEVSIVIIMEIASLICLYFKTND